MWGIFATGFKDITMFTVGDTISDSMKDTYHFQGIKYQNQMYMLLSFLLILTSTDL